MCSRVLYSYVTDVGTLEYLQVETCNESLKTWLTSHFSQLWSNDVGQVLLPLFFILFFPKTQYSLNLEGDNRVIAPFDAIGIGFGYKMPRHGFGSKTQAKRNYTSLCSNFWH